MAAQKRLPGELINKTKNNIKNLENEHNSN
jgi:hypothetical protein